MSPALGIVCHVRGGRSKAVQLRKASALTGNSVFHREAVRGSHFWRFQKTGSDGSRKDGSFIVLIFQKGAQGCHLEIQDKNSKMIFGGFFFMGANTAKRCVCVFLVFRSVASSFKDLVDQVHLVDQVPFWSWSGNLFVQLPKMMMMTLIPTTRWWHGKDFVGCCQKKSLGFIHVSCLKFETYRVFQETAQKIGWNIWI